MRVASVGEILETWKPVGGWEGAMGIMVCVCVHVCAYVCALCMCMCMYMCVYMCVNCR